MQPDLRRLVELVYFISSMENEKKRSTDNSCVTFTYWFYWGKYQVSYCCREMRHHKPEGAAITHALIQLSTGFDIWYKERFGNIYLAKTAHRTWKAWRRFGYLADRPKTLRDGCFKASIGPGGRYSMRSENVLSCTSETELMARSLRGHHWNSEQYLSMITTACGITGKVSSVVPAQRSKDEKVSGTSEQIKGCHQ